MSQDAYKATLDEIDRILDREPEADEALRQTVAALHEKIPGYTWVGLSFVEEGALALGPWSGERGESDTTLAVPVVYDGTHIATLAVAASHDFTDADQTFLDRVALLISLQCLVGWDTGGVPWSDVG
jgi:putative methionine-R-sulfoxide reductase with GAF domain